MSYSPSTTPTPAAHVIAAVCGDCQAETPARHQPDACFACGSIGGPWVLVLLSTQLLGSGCRVGMRMRLAGAWTAAAREQARVDLGDALEGG